MYVVGSSSFLRPTIERTSKCVIHQRASPARTRSATSRAWAGTLYVLHAPPEELFALAIGLGHEVLGGDEESLRVRAEPGLRLYQTHLLERFTKSGLVGQHSPALYEEAGEVV